MDRLDHLHRPVGLALEGQNHMGLRVDEGDQRSVRRRQGDPGGVLRVGTDLVEAEPGPLRPRRKRGLYLGLGALRPSFQDEAIVGPVQDGLDLGLEQVGRSSQRQDDHEGNAEQPGVEVPTPDRPVGQDGLALSAKQEPGLGHGAHHRLLRSTTKVRWGRGCET